MSSDREITLAEAIELERQAQDLGNLLVWTITWGTSDKGDCFTVRPHWVRPGRVDIMTVFMHADSLDELRAKLPPGLIRMEPAPEDDPVIVEFWL